MNAMRVSMALIGAYASLAGSFATGSPPLAIRGVTVHAASSAPVEGATVLVRDGLIEAVGAGVTVPADAWTIEGIGLHVYPGLINSLCHWGIPPPAPRTPVPPGGARSEPPIPAPPPRSIGPEDRPANSSWLHAQDLIRHDDKVLAGARNAGFTTAIVYPREGIFAGQGAAVNLAGERSGEMVVSAPVAQRLSLSTTGFSSFPGSLMGAIAYVRQVYLDASHYAAESRAYAQGARGKRRPGYDRALEGVIGSPRILLPASLRREYTRMAALARELGRPVILYGGHEAFLAAEALKQSGLPLLFDLKWPERDREADPESKESLRTLERYENAASGPSLLAKAGVRFAFYSGGVEKPEDLRTAVKKAIDAGLDREDALRALTLWAATIHGFADRTGSIETGKIANLVVADGDLFSDRTKIRHVIIDGVKYDPPAAAAKDDSKEDTR